MLDNQQRSYRAKCLQETELYYINSHEFLKIFTVKDINALKIQSIYIPTKEEMKQQILDEIS
jgi:hypothetical protein